MIETFVASVGDGLAMGIKTVDFSTIQIDCGTQQDAQTAVNVSLCRLRPRVFILSHFHLDHYNGLFAWGPENPPLSIQDVYFPRLPDMADQKEYANCILALNRRLMGDDSGVMEVDFRRAIKRINGGRPFRYCPLSKGDSFTVGSSVFNVLWPPPKVTLDGGANGVSRAIQLFHEALQVDERLKQAYEQITSSDFHNPYLIQEEEEACGQVEPIEHGAVMKPVHNAHERLPLKLKAANEALRSAANKMSLCFIEDNRFLFMGDLTKAEIPLLVQELKVLGRTHFSVLITPHHGTHWHNSLNNLHCRWALSSVGPKLVGKTWPDFRNIAHEHLVTHFTGHICLSATARRMCHPGESWSCGREW